MADDIRSIPLKTNAGAPATLADYDGQVLMIVNVASKCGLTPQYAALEALHAKYREQGFAVLGFPADDFAGQEPGSDAEIASFCEANFGVTFPLFAKAAVTGDAKQPLYAALIEAAPQAEGGDDFRARLTRHGMTPTSPPEVLWNFEKFLVGRDGSVVARFPPDVAPDDDRVVTAVERELFASE